MINEENLNKLYERVLDGLEIKTNELNQIGFNSKDIKRLIEQETIQRVKRGLYTFIDSKGLFEYSNKIRTSKDNRKSIQYLEKCYQIDPTNERVSYLIFFYLIMEGEYNQAITYYDNFANNSSVTSKANSNFYLYLLSMITILPEKHRKYAQNLKLEDLFETSIKPKYKSDRSLNKIKELAFKQKFSYAYSCLNQSQEIFDNYITMAIITKKLLREAALIRRLDRECILRKINQEDYEGIINYYNEIKKYHNLNEIDNCVLYLAQNIVNINYLKHIPPIFIFTTTNLQEAIKGNNFELALKICQKILEMHNVNRNSHLIFLLLDKIVKMCKEIDSSLVLANQMPNNRIEAKNEPLSSLDNQSPTKQNDLTLALVPPQK